jgi:hypothetical protein
MYRLEPDGTTVLDSLDANPQAVMMAGGPESTVGATPEGVKDEDVDLIEPVTN